MTDVLAFDPTRRTSAQAIVDLVTLGYLNKDQFILDATFGKGRFWTKWEPDLMWANDINPDRDTLYDFDYRDLPWKDGSFDVTVFDPPFKLNGTSGGGGPATCDGDYGVGGEYRTLNAIRKDCLEGFGECVRVTKPGGLILYKTQDQVSGGRKRWLSKEMWAFWCSADLIDELYIVGSRAQPRGRPQVHSRGNVSVLQVYRRTV
jgi:hypothetical protein